MVNLRKMWYNLKLNWNLLLTSLFLGLTLHAQKAMLSGTIRDSITGSTISFTSSIILDP